MLRQQWQQQCLLPPGTCGSKRWALKQFLALYGWCLQEVVGLAKGERANRPHLAVTGWSLKGGLPNSGRAAVGMASSCQERGGLWCDDYSKGMEQEEEQEGTIVRCWQGVRDRRGGGGRGRGLARLGKPGMGHTTHSRGPWHCCNTWRMTAMPAGNVAPWSWSSAVWSNGAAARGGYSAWKLMGVCRWPLKIGPKKIEEKIEFGAKKIDFCKNW